MTLFNFATLENAPAPNDSLAALALALDGRHVHAARRVMTCNDSRSPDEGLALLDAYVNIADRDIRQAILDTVMAIANTDPYRHARVTTAAKSTAPMSDDPVA